MWETQTKKKDGYVDQFKLILYVSMQYGVNSMY